jgi:hypothetical protein
MSGVIERPRYGSLAAEGAVGRLSMGRLRLNAKRKAQRTNALMSALK